MGDKLKIRKIKWGFVKENYSKLANAVSTIEGLSESQKEYVAGLAMEILDLCGGTPDLFEDDIFIDDEEFDDL